MPRTILWIFMRGAVDMKKIVSFILVVATCLTLSGPVVAVDAQPEVVVCSETGEIQPRVEETIWYFRTVDGVKQKRLWSITYGVWLTDWITVG